MLKRAMDILLAGIGLVLLLPLLVALAILVRFTSAGPVFFKQERIGRRFRPFQILKFRSMVADAPLRGGPITIGDDPRITRVGRFLRKTKLDELPQLFNVLKGDMSLVGPRPEARCYVEMFRQDYETILRVRPGVTDLASLKYRNESEVLARADDPEMEYVSRVLPEKIQLAKEYVARSSIWFDLWIVAKTVLILLHFNAPSREQTANA